MLEISDENSRRRALNSVMTRALSVVGVAISCGSNVRISRSISYSMIVGLRRRWLNNLDCESTFLPLATRPY